MDNLTAQQEDYLLEASRDIVNDERSKIDVLIEKDEMFDNFMIENQVWLEKEFSEIWECLRENITDIYPKEWNDFCKEEFGEYVNDLKMENI